MLIQKTLKYFLLSLFFLGCFSLSAQELNCKVTVNSDQIQGTNKDVFEALQKAMTEFMNDRKWTEQEYLVEERIECSLYLMVNAYNNGSFSGELRVQVNRPIYASSYKSPLFSFNDKFINFLYNEGDALTWDASSFGQNLTEIMAFYAYIILGTDGDSFSKFGGSAAYKKAEDIVNQAQSASERGWRAFEDNQNRYALINSILLDGCKPFREYFYTYHRLALDEMTISPDKSRGKIHAGLPVLKSIYKEHPATIIISEFVEAKLDELLHIYSKASSQERKEAYEILSYVAPTMGHKLDELKK